MTTDEELTLHERLKQARAVVVLRARHYCHPGAVAETFVAAGLSVLEFTLTGSNALEAATEARAATDAFIGIGSVTTPEQAVRAAAAGVDFLVAPVADPDLAAAVPGVPVILGGTTPTELLGAWRATRQPVKVFPASIGGPAYVSAIRGPLPDLPLVPSGGIHAGNVAAYLDRGVLAVNVGTAAATPSALESGDIASIHEAATEVAAALEAWRSTRRDKDG